MALVTQEIVIDASPEVLFHTIVDYEAYPEFLPENKYVKVLERDDGHALVRFEVELMMRFAYTLRLEEEPEVSVSWVLEESRVLSKNAGGWRLEALGATQTHAQYTLELELMGKIPASVEKRVTERSLPKTLEHFKRRAEQMQTQAT